jgi:hypothetical protein
MKIKGVIRMAKRKSRLFLTIAVVLIAVILLALVIFLGTQSNQDLTPGVKAGDEFIYDINGSWNSIDPNATVPLQFFQLNMTDWYKVTITNVNGSKVSIDTEWRFENGTEVNTTGYVNIESGTVFPTGGFWPIYASNLKVNDRARPSGMEQIIVNETDTKEYAAGVIRETNFLNQEREYYDADDPTGSTTWTNLITIQFDKQAGILVQLSDISIYNNPQLILTTTWKLKESNVWAVS